MFHRQQQVATTQGENETPRPIEAEQGREGGAAMSGTGEPKKMTCAEFQEVLPYIFESGGHSSEMEHLKGCQICSDLVKDLQYIADQAKLLLPRRNPIPKSWKKSRNSPKREGRFRQRVKGKRAEKKK